MTLGRSVLLVFAKPWPDHPATHESQHTARHVNDGRTGKIHMAVADAKVRTQGCQPSAAPYPVSK